MDAESTARHTHAHAPWDTLLAVFLSGIDPLTPPPQNKKEAPLPRKQKQSWIEQVSLATGRVYNQQTDPHTNNRKNSCSDNDSQPFQTCQGFEKVFGNMRNAVVI